MSTKGEKNSSAELKYNLRNSIQKHAFDQSGPRRLGQPAFPGCGPFPGSLN